MTFPAARACRSATADLSAEALTHSRNVAFRFSEVGSLGEVCFCGYLIGPFQRVVSLTDIESQDGSVRE
ncbi:MAG: hypothetical protein QOH31_3143 [Verrucomicrobiota bacterium]|jgi:hypothetical protein